MRLLTHDAHRLDVGRVAKEGLIFNVQTGGADLPTDDGVGTLEDGDLVRGDFTDDPDTRSGTKEAVDAGIDLSFQAQPGPSSPAIGISSQRRPGSTSSTCMFSGRPPTLWRFLILAALAVPDWITSGQRVPCT